MTLSEKIRDLAAQYADRLKNRIKVITDAGYTPIRVMFYYPNRMQAIRIQQTLATLYEGIGGHYYFGDKAWGYVKHRTGFHLKSELESIARENASQ